MRRLRPDYRAVIAFIRARLDEDERLALAASPGPWHLNAEHDEVIAVDDTEVCTTFALSSNQQRNTARHIARHDPARIFRQAAALRELVDTFASIIDGNWTDAGEEALAEQLLPTIAEAWSDHPNYWDGRAPARDRHRTTDSHIA